MPINANVTNQQITASVGETKIDVSVSGGVGPSGSNGAAGASATVTVGTVTTGAPGSSATVTNSGTSSAAVLDFTIPAGAAGAAGAAGPAGATGATGAQGPAGVVAATAPVTYDAGTQTVALSVGSGLSTSGGSLVVSYGTSAGTACQGNDARLSDARTPVSHTHTAAQVTDFSTAAAAAAPVQSVNGQTGAVTIASYSLPVATNTVLGGVKQGANTTIGADGTISVAAPVTSLPYSSITGTPALAAVATSGSASDLTGTLADARLSANVVRTTDSRLSDARTPTGHSHGNISSLGQLPVTALATVAVAGPVVYDVLARTIGRGEFGTSAGQVCQGNDSRLSDTRVPTDGSVTDAKITAAGLSTSSLNWAAIAEWQPSTAYNKGDLVSFQGIAYRRSAAGTSGATFNSANWQQITPSEFVGSQITSGTLATARLGSGTADATTFLRGDGAWATPAGGTPTVASPSQITSNQNDYAGATADINRLSSDAARDITGFSGGTDGKTIVLVNVGSNAITLKHQDTGSTAGNRIIVPWAADYILDADGAAVLVYDNTTSRWRVI